MTNFESAALTDVGRKRKGNEDSYYLDDALGLYVVADGMGGHQAGEVASRVLVDTVRDYMIRFKGEVSQKPEIDELADAAKGLSKEANRLLASVTLANSVVNSFARSKEAYKGMGATVSAVYLVRGAIIACNVGDSPIYLLRDNTVQPLYVPHTVLAEQANLGPAGGMPLGEAFSHMLTRAVGSKETVEADISERPCRAGDVLILCSDGLSDKVTPEEIKALARAEAPAKACRSLLDLALDRGGDDNITVLAVKVKKVPEAPMDRPGFLARLFGKR